MTLKLQPVRTWQDQNSLLVRRSATREIVHQIADFTVLDRYGWWFPQGIEGAGPDRETYQIVPHTSTKNPPNPGTNPIHIMAVGSMDVNNPATGVVAGGFTLHATPQGHMYGGLRVSVSTDAYIHDVVTKGTPGDAPGPNTGNETFAIGMWHANGVHLKNISLLGLDDSGTAVMATGFGFNFQDDILMENVAVHHALHGMGITWWMCYSAEVRGADLRNNRKPINLERCYDGAISIYDMDIRGYTNSVPVTVNSDLGSTVLTFYDPIWDTSSGPFRVGLAPNAYSGNQRQKLSDVHLVLNGVDVSSNTSKLHVGPY